MSTVRLIIAFPSLSSKRRRQNHVCDNIFFFWQERFVKCPFIYYKHCSHCENKVELTPVHGGAFTCVWGLLAIHLHGDSAAICLTGPTVQPVLDGPHLLHTQFINVRQSSNNGDVVLLHLME